MHDSDMRREAVAAAPEEPRNPDQRLAWERPVLRRLGADRAESGLLVGGEVIILLHTS